VKLIDVNEKNKNNTMFLSCLTYMKIDNRYIIICGLEFKNE